MKEFEIYKFDSFYCAVCSSLPLEETEKKLNEELPVERGWIFTRRHFPAGEENPHPCEKNPETHRHYFFSC